MDTELEMTSETDEQVDPAEMVRRLDPSSRTFPEKELRWLQQHREVAIPMLIQAIERATEQVRAGLKLTEHAAWIGFPLLWQFEAKDAWPAILNALKLPRPGPGDIFGDGISEEFPQFLVLTAGDKWESIDAMIDDPEIDWIVRWSIADSYRFRVRDGIVSREEAVSRLREHLRLALDRKDVEGVTFCVLNLCDLNPHEAVDEINEAFDRDLVETFMIDRDSVYEMIAGGAAHSQKALGDLRPTRLDDAVEHMRGWACFRPILKYTPPTKPLFKSPAPRSDYHDEVSAVAVVSSSATGGPIRNESPRIGRNDPCPCGSGKKYKKCCMRESPL